MTDSIKVVITKEFLDKVKYFCKNIPKLEWSGIVFYNIEGSIKDASSMVITPIEIMIRDIGTAVHTGFNYDETCMNFITENDLLMARHGMIHSHNTMRTFFSGEDVDELQDNVGNHNVYLSLIVNNFSDMVARVAFVARPANFSTVDEDGTEYEFPLNGAKPVMMYHECAIEMPHEEIVVSDVIKNSLKIVKKETKEREAKLKLENEKKAKEAAEYAKNNPPKQIQGGHYPPSRDQYPGWGGNNDLRSFTEGHQRNFDYGDQAGIEDNEPIDTSDYDNFFAYCFNGGSHTPIEAIEMVEDITDEHGEDIVTDSVVTNYATYYQNFYETERFGIEEEDFKICLEEFIEFAEGYSEEYPWLSTLAIGLKLIGNKFEELNLNNPQIQNLHEDTDSEV